MLNNKTTFIYLFHPRNFFVIHPTAVRFIFWLHDHV